ncbi:hypothetical protein [Roseibium sp.]|uniref:hypothetical protein n=1 Tax=Roseibium sp. TaxID=1936156 RepID=UPI003A984990
MRVELSVVAVTEICILLAALVFILHKGLFAEDLTPSVYLLLTLVVALYTCVINKAAIVDYFRNILILFCFVTLGTWTNTATVKRLFSAVVLAVLAGLAFEAFFTEAYGDLFWPALYFENTRGIEPAEFTDSKLFRNALGFEGRFTFGILGHRSSSLFLEQVSLANFAGVMIIYLLALWQELSRFQRTAGIVTVVAILLTNDSRTMLIFSLVCIVGYFIFPALPRAFAILTMPVILILGVLVYLLNPTAEGDNIPGRIALTIKKFGEMGLADYLGFSAEHAAAFADSGYAYVIIIGTGIGLLLYWLFVCLYPACNNAEERRFTHGLAIFIFMNMMIGGTAIFSIKVAGLMWLLAGHMKFGRWQSPDTVG